MIYKQLGTSDLRVSVISYGCMSLGHDQKENTRLIHRANDLGINLFDTADIYQNGLNEIFVGNALSDRRDKVIIASKVGNQPRPDGNGWNWNPSKAYIKENIFASLRRLKTDYIDLYQLHGGTINDPIDETIEAFEELKQAGHIRYYGISSIRPNVIREYLKRSRIVSNMMQFSLLDRRPEETCLDLIHRNNVSVIVRGGVAKGLLAGKAPKAYLDHSEAEVIQAQNLLADLSSPQRSLAQTALKYCLANPAVATIACGASSIQQLEENIGTINAPNLKEEEIIQLRDSIKAGKYLKHR